MAGYAARTEPGTGKLHDLWAKALAVEDEAGNRAVIVTADIIGFSLDITDAVSKRIEEAHGIPRGNLLYNASHTHCGPVVRNNGLHVTYGLEGEEQERAIAYTEHLSDLLYQVIDASIKDLAPGAWGGRGRFARTAGSTQRASPTTSTPPARSTTMCRCSWRAARTAPFAGSCSATPATTRPSAFRNSTATMRASRSFTLKRRSRAQPRSSPRVAAEIRTPSPAVRLNCASNTARNWAMPSPPL